MKQNILFIDPQGGYSTSAHIGLGYIASSLKNDKECNFKIFDFNRINEPYENILKSASKEQKVEGIGITLNIGSMHAVPDLLKKIKIYFPEAKVFIGGPHVSLLCKKLLTDFAKYVDFAVIGETERTISGIVENIHNRDALSKLTGVVFKEDLDEEHTADLVNNLDELDFPSYEYFESVKRSQNQMESYQILTSRGCPFSCTYCAAFKISGRKWRYRSPQNVVEEIEFAFKKYKTNNLEIVDDNFPLSQERTMAIMEMILEKNIKMRFRFANGIRADKIDEENLAIMKRAGLFEATIGIEAANPELFLSINKGETFDKIEKAVKLLRKFDIKIGGNFIIGLPGASLDKDMASVKFASKYHFGWRSTAWFYFIPYPFTEAYDIFKKEVNDGKMIESSYQRGGFTAQHIETPNYPLEERIIVRSIGSRIPPLHPEFSKWKLLKLFLKMEATIFKHRDENLGLIKFHLEMLDRIIYLFKLYLRGKVHKKAYF